MLTAIGCSKKSVSLEEYYTRLSTVQSSMAGKMQAAQQSLAQQMAKAKTDAQKLAVFKQLMSLDLAAEKAAVDVLRTIQPPDEVTKAHQNFVAAIDASNASLQAMLDNFDSYKTVADVQKALQEPAVQDPAVKIDAACAELQKTADAHKIQISLSCGQPSGAPATAAPTVPAPASP